MPASLFVFMGLIASGKSSLAQAFAEEFSFPYFNTDVVRKELAGKAPSSRQADAFGQGIYSPAFTRLTYDTLLDHARRELSVNHYVVLDGSYLERGERQRAMECAAGCAASFFFILCRCDDEETRRRLALRASDPLAVSDGTWEIYQRQKESLEFPDELASDCLIVMDTRASVPELLRKLRAKFSQIAAA
ncbi:MAG: AAA family ATPase [Deltaproteobacteria bacterium]|nr:AAA family ATPase [Deltaproteobacteria bacterium]